MKTTLAILVSEPGQPDKYLLNSDGSTREYTKNPKKAKKALDKAEQRSLRDESKNDLTPKKPGKKKPKRNKGKGKGKGKGKEPFVAEGKLFSDEAEVKMVDISEEIIPQRDVYVLPTGTRKDLTQLSKADRKKRIRIFLAPDPEIRTQIQDSQD